MPTPPEVTYLHGALVDLQEICEYLFDTSRSGEIGNRLLAALHRAALLHARYPAMGSSRSELGEDVRCFCVWQYVAFFAPAEDGIAIVRVIHGARDIPAEFHNR